MLTPGMKSQSIDYLPLWMQANLEYEMKCLREESAENPPTVH